MGTQEYQPYCNKEDRQIIALNDFGVEDKNIFLDKVSGKDFNRPNYKRMLKKLRQGDTLVIKSIDRLGRDYDEVIQHWRMITKEIKAFVVVLDLPILDTRMKNEHDITGTLISDVVLALFGYVAQMERENLRIRQAEGIAVAKAKGVRFGVTIVGIFFVAPLFQDSARAFIDFPTAVDFQNWQSRNRTSGILFGVIAATISLVALLVSLRKKQNGELRKTGAKIFAFSLHFLLLIIFSIIVSVSVLNGSGLFGATIRFHIVQFLFITLTQFTLTIGAITLFIKSKKKIGG